MNYNNKKDNIVIIGSGAQAKYVVDIFSYYKNFKIVGVVKTGKEIDKEFKQDLKGIKIIEDLQHFKKYILKKNIKAIVTVADNRQKESIIRQLEKLKVELINVVHPKAVISKTTKMGKNVLINAGAVIQPYASIGKGVMIHANVVVDHNCIIEDYANLAPGAKLAGWVKVGKGAYIYTGASIIPSIKIGAHSIIGAGAVVIKDIPSESVVVGNPAKIIKNKNVNSRASKNK